MAQLHGSAVVDPAARLAEDVQVGPMCVIEADVEVGAGTVLLPGTVLLQGSRIGADCRLGPYAAVGGLPMDRDFRGERSFAVLEARVDLRDFASVHRATGEGAATTVGAGTLVMSYAHVSHNAQVGSDVVLTTHVQLGGHSSVGSGAVLGANAMVHQFARVGRLAMVAAAAGCRQDALPFGLVGDFPAVHYGTNRLGLRRAGLGRDARHAIAVAFRALRHRDTAALDAAAEEAAEAAEIREFLATTRRGVARFASS